MPSAEGRGRARAAWDAYARATKRHVQPVIEKTLVGDAIRSVSANSVSDLVGFWMLWHLYGGFEGLQGLGMSRSSIFRKTALFRKLFGAHPDEFEFPGVTIDVEAYLKKQLATEDSNDT
jgi:hypothetical protein